MNEQNDKGEGLAILYLFIVVAVGYVAIVIVSLIGVMLTICLTAAAVLGGCWMGYKLAVDSQVWESRRIAQHQKIEAARRREKEYFARRGQEWMVGFADQYYDDKVRDLYNRKDPVHETAKTVKKVKDIFR
jgi:hypothetical protein